MVRRVAERGRSSDTEKWIARFGVTWEFVTGVSAGSFDIEASLKNQARLGDPVDQTLVDEYVLGLRNGDDLPAVVAYRGDGGKYVIIDGNHRLKAHQEVEQPLAVYEVQGRRATLIVMTYEANTPARHGKVTAYDDRVKQALFLVDQDVSARDAARRLNVKAGDVSGAAAKREADRRSVKAGILPTDWLRIKSDAARRRLASINTDGGFRAAVRLSIDAGLGAQAVSDLVTFINESRSEAEQEQMVAAKADEYRDRIQETLGGDAAPAPGRPGAGRSPRARLGSALGLVKALPPVETILDSYHGAERSEAAEACRAGADHLNTLADKLLAEA